MKSKKMFLIGFIILAITTFSMQSHASGGVFGNIGIYITHGIYRLGITIMGMVIDSHIMQNIIITIINQDATITESIIITKVMVTISIISVIITEAITLTIDRVMIMATGIVDISQGNEISGALA